MINNNTCVVEATNKGAKEATGDVLIYVSDDMFPPDRWGELLENEIITNNYNDEFLIKVNDGLQPFNIAIATVPIISKKMYETQGYLWHPEYKSMFCDEFAYWKAKTMGWLKLAPHITIQHEHPSNGKAINDQTYIDSAKNWDQGKSTFARHKSLNFNV